jgi:hypothetical protein
VSADVPSGTVDDFAQMWAWFATHCHDTSPLYERISLAVAGDPELLEYLRTVPPSAQLPPALLAAVHYLVLEGADTALTAIYAGEAHEDPGPRFLDFWRAQRDAVDRILATRHIQTNDCGRSALLAPGLTWVASRFDRPLALVDVGASAGLNLRCDSYRIDYGSFGVTGPDDSPVRIDCEVVGGRPPIAPRLPHIASRIGIDRSPVDLGGPDDVRWLLACIWPDSGRLERTAASIRLAQADPPQVVAADANDALPGILAELPEGALATVVTTWAFAYLGADARAEFIGHLAAASRRRDVAWLSAEGPGTVGPLDAEVATHPDRAGSDVLGAVLFHDGVPEARLLGFAQGHGGWIDWRAA